MSISGRTLIIFAKEPALGRVKTRLLGRFTAQQCMALYEAFVRDTIHLAQAVRCDCRAVAYDADGQMPRFLKACARRFFFHRQTGPDLGARMVEACEWAFKNGSREVVIIGSDMPHLPVHLVEAAFKSLTSCDAVLGPACDGGFYLIGLKEPLIGGLTGIPWSTVEVFKLTLCRLRKAGLETAVLQEWYDIDTEADLICLGRELDKNSIQGTPHTANVLNGLLKSKNNPLIKDKAGKVRPHERVSRCSGRKGN